MSGPAKYSLTDIGGLGGKNTYARALNDLGQVVGQSQSADGTYWPFLWEKGKMVRLDAGLTDRHGGQANDINNRGEVVGSFGDPVPLLGFYWKDSVFHLADPLDNDTESAAIAINDSGVAVGTSTGRTAERPDRGFLWEPSLGQPKLLVSSGEARSINSQGVVAGSIDGQAFVMEDGAITTLCSQGIRHSVAQDLNDSKWVIGWSNPYPSLDRRQALLWREGQLVDLGSWGGSSYPISINNLGQVVGYASINNILDDFHHAWLWEEGQLFDLNDLVANSDLEIVMAMSVNNRGLIVGSALDQSGNFHGVLLQPVPEPLFGLAIGVGLFFQRRDGHKISL